MITISEYARILEGVQDIIHMQTEGLSDSELLVQPQTAATAWNGCWGISRMD